MNALLFALINGFLLSISSSSVTTNNSSGPSPVVIQQDSVAKKPLPYAQPQFPQPQNNNLIQGGTPGIKTSPKVCPNSNPC